MSSLAKMQHESPASADDSRTDNREHKTEHGSTSEWRSTAWLGGVPERELGVNLWARARPGSWSVRCHPMGFVLSYENEHDQGEPGRVNDAGLMLHFNERLANLIAEALNAVRPPPSGKLSEPAGAEGVA
jgi:hypothetical protein